MDGAMEALERLSARFDTVLYSQASHPEYQLGRMRAAGIMEVLMEDRIRITPRKTVESFLEALDSFGLRNPEAALMIGNSMRSDINPALEAGSDAFLVEPYEMWHYDNVAAFSQGFLRFETFPRAVDHLLQACG